MNFSIPIVLEIKCLLWCTNKIYFAAGVDYYECSAYLGIGLEDVLNGTAMTGLGLVKK